MLFCRVGKGGKNDGFYPASSGCPMALHKLGLGQPIDEHFQDGSEACAQLRVKAPWWPLAATPVAVECRRPPEKPKRTPAR